MNIFKQYMVAWLWLFGVYLAVGVVMELTLHSFHGNWFALLSLVVGVPTAMVGGFALSRMFHRQ